MHFMSTQSGVSTRSAAAESSTSPCAEIAAAKAAMTIVVFIILFQVVICEQPFITTSRYEEILS